MAMRLPGESLVVAAWLIALCASSAPAQVLERGAIIDRVQCIDDPEQTYALLRQVRRAAFRIAST